MSTERGIVNIIYKELSATQSPDNIELDMGILRNIPADPGNIQLQLTCGKTLANNVKRDKILSGNWDWPKQYFGYREEVQKRKF